MDWRVVRESNTLRRGILAGLFGLFLSCGLPYSVGAVDSEIGALVCGSGSPGASIQITQPINDSVVNQTPTTFRGTINNTSQIVVEIDEGYVSTLAIGSNQTTFAIDLSMSEGTHTIKTIANDICGGTDADDHVVITYQPAIEPSNGAATPTTVEGAVTLDGTPVTEEEVKDNDLAQQIEQLPLIGSAVSAVSDFAQAIGLTSTISGASQITATARVGLTVAAMSAVVMAGSIAPLAVQAVPGISELFNTTSHRSLIYTGWIIRAAGLLMFGIVYFL